jgi:hypothetical protein
MLIVFELKSEIFRLLSCTVSYRPKSFEHLRPTVV